MKYYHAVPVQERNTVLNSDMTLYEFIKKYKQPEWCKYPEALLGILGCWSLFPNPENICESFCEHCDMFNPEWRKQELIND